VKNLRIERTFQGHSGGEDDNSTCLVPSNQGERTEEAFGKGKGD